MTYRERERVMTEREEGETEMKRGGGEEEEEEGGGGGG